MNIAFLCLAAPSQHLIPQVEHLKKRCKYWFVRKALTQGGHPALDNFLSKKLSN